MPLITSSGQKVYGRHEQAPRPERKKKDDKKGDDDSTDSSSATSTTQHSDNWTVLSFIKEIFGLLVVVGLITWSVYLRKDGMISVNGSVMSSNEAAVYSNYIELAGTQTFLTPVQIPTTTDPTTENNDADVVAESVDAQFQGGACGDYRLEVFEGGETTVSYTLSTPNSPTPLLQSQQPIRFTTKSLQDAVLTGSTLPLLHFMTVGMCKGQEKKIEFTQDTLNTLLSNPHPHFNPTQNQLMLTLFPTLTSGPRKDLQSTLTLPFTFGVTVVDVVSQHTITLLQKQEDQIKLKNGDMGAFFRATVGSIHPLALLLAYVGMRFGAMYYNRWRIKQYRRKREAEAKANGATEEQIAQIKQEEVTLDDVVQDQVDTRVAEMIAEQITNKKQD